MEKSKKHWRDLSPTTRRALVLGGSLDLALRAWAIVDLLKRPQEQVRGSKSLWAVGLVVVNSVGTLPAAYLAWGRRD